MGGELFESLHFPQVVHLLDTVEVILHSFYRHKFVGRSLGFDDLRKGALSFFGDKFVFLIDQIEREVASCCGMRCGV
jgi:hypothetical protein